MSTSSKSDNDYSYDVEDLLQIKSRCGELRKEKDMLRESQSQSFDLIRRLELHVKTLSKARSEDKKHIQELERELRNCSQEIDYLQDQLSARDAEANCLGEQVRSLGFKLADMEYLHEEVGKLREELKKSSSECLFLMQELESKEVKLHESTAYVEKLEELISSTALESQCEIESMKLDLMALEQNYSEAKKFLEENIQERAKMNESIQDLEVLFQDAQKIIACLDEENKDLKEKLERSDLHVRVFAQKIEERFTKWLDDKDGPQFKTQSSYSELVSKEMSTCGEVLGPLLSKLAVVAAPDADLEDELEKMSCQIHEYELLVKQLKEELREEKLKAKEEAEDLAQEMAELRYQITDMLEHECKRRASIEQASLQRIAELEAQIKKEPRKSFTAVGHFDES